MIDDATATIVHVPHASRSIPMDLRRDFLLNDVELERELDVLTDHYTDKLFFDPESTATQLAFPVSRFVVNTSELPNQFRGWAGPHQLEQRFARQILGLSAH